MLSTHHHVLAFDGIGGIGKSALARRFVRHLKERKQEAGQKYGCAHVDLTNAKDSPVQTLLQIRLQLGATTKDIGFPIFDMAFARYHNAIAPSSNVREQYGLMDTGGSIVTSISRVVTAPQSDSELLNDIVDGIDNLAKDTPLIGLGYRLANKFFAWGQEEWATRAEALLEDLNQAGFNLIADRLPLCLAADISRYLANKSEKGIHDRPLIIIGDTLEALTGASADNWLRELIFNTKGVLFVLLGRDKINWAAHEGNPRRTWGEYINQYSLGALEDAEMEKILVACHVKEPEIRTQMIEGAEGIPFYLGLQLDIYRDTLADGAIPEVGDYGGRRDEVVNRFMDHLSEQYRTSLETLAHANSINADLDWFLREQYPALARDLTFEVLRNYSFSEDIDANNIRLHQHMRDILQARVEKNDPRRTMATHSALFSFYDPLCTPENVKAVTEHHGISFIQAHHHRSQYDIENSIGWSLERSSIFQQAARYHVVEQVLSRTLKLAQNTLGEEHPSTATSYNNVASNLNAQGRLQEAEPLYRKALEIRERVLGEEHPSTATSYNNVASNLNAQGRLQEAEPLLRKALEIWERVLGEEHPDTASSYNNVAYNLDAQGRLQEAEPLLRKALEIRERMLGEEHPSTATSYNNVASNLDAQGRLQEAEPLYRKALEIRERVLGEEHPSTATSYNNVASNLNAQGRLQEAEPLYRKALEIRERMLGEEHPDTASSYNNVASNLDDQGRLQEAEPLLRKALEIRERVLGEEHPDTASSYNNVAYNLDAQGRLQEAEPLYRKALEIRERVLGEEHPSTATSYNNVALNLDAQGRLQEAEPLLRKALEIWERVLGEEHPSTATSYNNVAYNLDAQGRLQEAEPLYRKALEIRERVLGEEHPSTATSYNNVASNLNAQGRLQEAEPLYRKALEICERMLGEEHPTTEQIRSNLQTLKQETKA